ncbi:GNAT family N-acetyltransferase [Nesterenkonia lutea]|uniref:Ribosomal protein S18 acetylase RimI-like enzyme n=1 Tax=Nesterenkonia lutea TaxID=272919 RepID=A0ABR9JDU8_9MICC|nr:GNAT family N-acetyltransferase [Nesterenkonia lutea]MBE1523965.1 ribosomal protein S18 acetylase RimI-like enzyme [Nesterenkonia lutea]
MTIRLLSSSDRPLLREATLANMNWDGPSFTFDDIDAAQELSHYFTSFPSGSDFGLAHQDGDVVRAVAWLVFLPDEDPGYGFVDADTPELSITTFTDFRGHGIGSALLAELIHQARHRGLTDISLSVEDGNGARRIYERAGFNVVGRNGSSDTMLLSLR